MMRALGLVLLLPATLLFAWGLGLVVTVDQGPEGARGMFGWIFLLSGGVVLISTAGWAIVGTRRR
jgi:hypothetical protein